MKLDIVVLASGNGSTFQAILDKCKRVNVRALITNNPKAYALERAKVACIPYAVTTHKDIRRTTQYFHPELIVLAGYMRILNPTFIKTYPRIVNIHPSLLPKYKGLNTYKRALADNESVHGCTVHWVNEELDAGEIIAQELVAVGLNDTVESLQARTQEAEQVLYPQIIDEIASGKHVIPT